MIEHPASPSKPGSLKPTFRSPPPIDLIKFVQHLMAAWAAYCEPGLRGNVVPLGSKASRELTSTRTGGIRQAGSHRWFSRDSQVLARCVR